MIGETLFLHMSTIRLDMGMLYALGTAEEREGINHSIEERSMKVYRRISHWPYCCYDRLHRHGSALLDSVDYYYLEVLMKVFVIEFVYNNSRKHVQVFEHRAWEQRYDFSCKYHKK